MIVQCAVLSYKCIFNAGTMGFIPRPPHPPMGSMYSLDLDRTVTKHLSGVYISNGLAWTGDNKTMFYIDSPPKKVYAFDFDLENGTVSRSMATCLVVFCVFYWYML